jgi:hypothetical protein
VKTIQELAHREAMPTEGDDGVNGQLAGAVHDAAATAVDPTDLDLPIPHQAALLGDLARRATPPDGDDRRMFT